MGLFDFFKTKKEHNRNFQGVGDTPLDTEFTPDNINTLGRRDIFVFGSNLAGHHAGGAARTALNRFGAIWGQGEGLQGNSYAIPTMQGGIETIRPYVEKFIEFTKREKSLTFYVTKIGCGIAGFNIEDIALLFKNAIDLPNVRLPKEFVEGINANGQNQFNNFTETQNVDNLDEKRQDKQDNISKYISRAPVKIIGVGGGGSNSVIRMFETPLSGVEYCVINTNSYAISHSKVPLEFQLESNDPCGLSPRVVNHRSFEEYFANTHNEDCVKSILGNETKQLIIVIGFGGNSGICIAEWLTRIAANENIPTIIVGTMPFSFEEKERRDKAESAVLLLENAGLQVIRIEADKILESHKDILVKDVFPALDALVSNTVKELCEDKWFTNNTDVIPTSIKPSHEVTTHSFGMAKTFADIIIGLNKEKHYTIPEDALTDLGTYLQRFREQGDNIAFLSVRILINILHEPEMFSAGTLNTNYLRTKLFDDHHFENECDKAYDNYCREKLANLVCYLNEFRKYSSAEEVRNDLFSSTNVLQFSHCGPIEGFYYFQMSGATGMNYPVQFFISSIRELWTEITTDGILDADKMRTIMFGNHLNSISELGLEATIAKDYVEDGPCHPEVFFPKKFGTGPVYVKTKNGRYNRSCGEGKGPNRVPDYLEFEIALQILEKDKNYIKKNGFFIPKEDMSLPVYHVWEGKIVFSSLEEKIEFLHDIKKRK